MLDQNKYQTIASTAESFFKDRGSKFLGFAYPVSNAETIKMHLLQLKELHPKAVHYCYAYRLGHDGNTYRANDDGEPSGSAGKPILGQIDSAGLTNVLVVVVRYFGGTLLGVPGLINAYKTSAADALLQAEKEERYLTKPMALEFDYQKMGEVLYLLQKHEAIVESQELQLFCTIKVEVPCVFYEALLAKMKSLVGVKVAT